MHRHRLHASGFRLLVAGLVACAPADTGPELRARVAGAAGGGRVQLQLVADPAGGAADIDSLPVLLRLRGTAAAVSATITFDAAALAPAHVRGVAGVTLFSGEAQPGLLRVSVVASDALAGTLVRIVFTRRRPGAAWPVLRSAEAAAPNGAMLLAEVLRGVGARAAGRADTPAFPVAPSTEAGATPVRGMAILAPGVARYGDINGDGRVSVADVVVLGQATVGLRTILGDALVAANVAPTGTNGRATGAEADGQRRLSVADLTLVNQATVGTMIGAVGQVIPPAALGPRLLVTPLAMPVSGRTAACTDRLAAESAPFANPATGLPWPECIGADGLPMVVQLCVYEKAADLRWHASASTASAPRCLAELAQVQRGGL